jgi:hypothetical protein
MPRPSLLAATLLLQAPRQHHLSAFDASASAAGLQAKSSKHMKDIISQSAFLGECLLLFKHLFRLYYGSATDVFLVILSTFM